MTDQGSDNGLTGRCPFWWFSVILMVLCGASGPAAEPRPPLPPSRPIEAPNPLAPPPAGPDAPSPPSAPLANGAQDAEPGLCQRRLEAAGYSFEATSTPDDAHADCRIDHPVKIKAVPVAGEPGRSLRLPAEPVVACVFAESFGNWLGKLVAPTVKGSTGRDLAAVNTGPGLACRNRNRLPSGKLSAHAEGQAIDIVDFETADGTRIPIKPNGDAGNLALVNAVRQAACGWFTTVLGPGSDATHEDHLHVDLQKHGSNDRYRICQ